MAARRSSSSRTRSASTNAAPSGIDVRPSRARAPSASRERGRAAWARPSASSVRAVRTQRLEAHRVDGMPGRPRAGSRRARWRSASPSAASDRRRRTTCDCTVLAALGGGSSGHSTSTMASTDAGCRGRLARNASSRRRWVPATWTGSAVVLDRERAEDARPNVRTVGPQSPLDACISSSIRSLVGCSPVARATRDDTWVIGAGTARLGGPPGVACRP